MNVEPAPERVTVPELLERGTALATLGDAFAVARRGAGRMVFLSGDAGIGKSALVRAFCAQAAAEARVLVGSCDGLRTPRPLGPIVDIGRAVGGRLAEAAMLEETGQAVFAALLDELGSNGRTILVIEDVHWADEATLDILGMLGRRAETLGALVIVTYRTDELPPLHPLRIALGDLATAPGVLRLQLEPLSPEAVATLAEPHGIDAGDLHAKTVGNPFFVTEVLAGGNLVDVPATVRDAVLARTARLGEQARALLEAVAIVPRMELWLLEAIATDTLDALDDCLASGMLRSERHTVTFRHELARMTIEESLNPRRRVALNRAALEALRHPPDGLLDLARLAHHAEAAGAVAAVLEFAPAAGEHAAAVGAHREAAAQYARALSHSPGLPPAERAELLERQSFECYLTDQHDGAIGALEEAIACWHSVGNTRREGLALEALASRCWCSAGAAAAAEAAIAQSIAVLERLGPSPDLARAYAGASSLAMNLEKADESFAWGQRALALTDQERDVETTVYQLNNTGTMTLLLGRAEGRDALERSIALAETAGQTVHVGRGFIHLGWAAARRRDFELIERLADGIAYCREHGLELWQLYLIAHSARLQLDQGRWDEAAEAASYVLGRHQAELLRLLTLSILATVRARRGDPEVELLLAEAHGAAIGRTDLQHLAPVAIARTEAAALAHRPDLAADASNAVLVLAVERGAGWISGELALWRRRAGIDEPVPAGVAEPFAVHLSGDWEAAAALWRRIGCPYEAALALADADEVEPHHRALDELRALGAGPAAAAVARGLRERGVRGVARGPRPSTRAHPAGLTAREAEVLELVADGLQNTEIGERLFVSGRTIDHHVSSILRKLRVRTRAEASSEAVRLGLARESRSSSNADLASRTVPR